MLIWGIKKTQQYEKDFISVNRNSCFSPLKTRIRL